MRTASGWAIRLCGAAKVRYVTPLADAYISRKSCTGDRLPEQQSAGPF